MDIDITARHEVENKEVFNEYIKAKLEPLGERFPYLLSVNVTLEEENRHFKTKIIMQAGRRLGTIKACETNDDQRASFDLAYKKIEKQIIAKKEKLVEYYE